MTGEAQCVSGRGRPDADSGAFAPHLHGTTSPCALPLRARVQPKLTAGMLAAPDRHGGRI
jgi:hypothetical protein